MLSVREKELAKKYSDEILQIYNDNSPVPLLAVPRKEDDSQASGFIKIAKKFLMPREYFEPNQVVIMRPFADFVELSEFQYLIDILKQTEGKHAEASQNPNQNLINASIEAISSLTQPNYIIIPIAFYVSLHMESRGRGHPLIDYGRSSQGYYVGGRSRLRILWSNKYIKLNQKIIGSNRDGQWLYKSDSNERLRVEFELNEPTNLTLLVETIFKYRPPSPDKVSVIDFPADLCKFT